MRMFTFSAPKDGPWNSKIENINIGMFHVFLFHVSWFFGSKCENFKNIGK